jgi:hypothetical protein
VLAAQGRTDDARAALAGAAAAFRAAGLDYEAARCLRLLARLGAPPSGPTELAALLVVDADA